MLLSSPSFQPTRDMNTPRTIDQQEWLRQKPQPAPNSIPQKSPGPSGLLSSPATPSADFIGRPLPRTPPGSQLSEPAHSSTSTDLASINGRGVTSTSNSSPMSRSSPRGPTPPARTGLHSAQPSLAPSSPDFGGSNNTVKPGNAGKTGGSSLQPKPGSMMQTTSSTAQSTGATGSTADFSTMNVSPGKKGLPQPGPGGPRQRTSRQSLLSEEEALSYHAALTRPITSATIMSFIPPSSTADNINMDVSSMASSVSHGELPSRPARISSTEPLSIPSVANRRVSIGAAGNTLPTTTAISFQHSTTQDMRSSISSSILNQAPLDNITVSNNNLRTPAEASVVSVDPPEFNPHQYRRESIKVGSSEKISDFMDRSSNGSSTFQGSNARPRRQSMSLHEDDSSTLGRSKFVAREDPVGFSTPGFGAPLLIAKEGWLWRRGNLLTWKRCYAIGRYCNGPQPGIMTLFKDNEHLFPIKTIDMSECSEVFSRTADPKGSGRFEFKLATRREEIWLSTDTMIERTGWIDALNSLMGKGYLTNQGTIHNRASSVEHSSTSFVQERASSNSPAYRTQHSNLTRELSFKEQELERRRAETLLAQLEAWRTAARVTVNQHYVVREQLLERVMKSARTVQELLERSRVHLDTGSDQIKEVVKSHLECLKVHAEEPSINNASFKIVKSILVGFTVNLDTRASELKRAILAVDQYISLINLPSASSTRVSDPSGYSSGATDTRSIHGGPTSRLHSRNSYPPSVNISVHLVQVKDGYAEVLQLLESHSAKLKKIIDSSDAEKAQMLNEDAKEILRGLLRFPSYDFTPCTPDQLLPGAADTLYREDLVQLQRKSQATPGIVVPQSLAPPTISLTDTGPTKGANHVKPATVDDDSRSTPTFVDKNQSSGEPRTTHTLEPSVLVQPLPDQPPTLEMSTIVQKIQDALLPSLEQVSTKHNESLQSISVLLDNISKSFHGQLADLKEGTLTQRQEFDGLKDEIIDMMKLSVVDPGNEQKERPVIADIRSKLADISSHLAWLQGSNSRPILKSSTTDLNTGANSSLSVDTSKTPRLQSLHRAPSVNSPGGTLTIASPEPYLESANNEGSLTHADAGPIHPRIANIVRKFEDTGHPGRTWPPLDSSSPYELSYMSQSNHSVLSKLDQLQLLLEFINTAQCRIMAYQDYQLDHAPGGGRFHNVDDGRMMAVQDSMERVDQKTDAQLRMLQELVVHAGLSHLNTPTTDIDFETREAQGPGFDLSSFLLAREPSSAAASGSEPQPAFTQEYSTAENAQILSKSATVLAVALSRLEKQIIPKVDGQADRLLDLMDHFTKVQRQVDGQQESLLEQVSELRNRFVEYDYVGSTRAPVRSLIEPSSVLPQQQHSLDATSKKGWEHTPRNSSDSPSWDNAQSFDTTGMLDQEGDKHASISGNPRFLRRQLSASNLSGQREMGTWPRLYAKSSHGRATKSESSGPINLDRVELDSTDEHYQDTNSNDGVTKEESNTIPRPHPKQETPPITEFSKELTTNKELLSGKWEKPMEKILEVIRYESNRSEEVFSGHYRQMQGDLNIVHSLINELRTGLLQSEEMHGEISKIQEWISQCSRTNPSAITQDTSSVDTRTLLDEKVIASPAVLTDSLPNGVDHSQQTHLVTEVQEFKDQLETFTRVQMATFSELSDNVSGIEKMIRDMSRVLGVRRGGTLLRKKGAEEERALAERGLPRSSTSSTLDSTFSVQLQDPGSGAHLDNARRSVSIEELRPGFEDGGSSQSLTQVNAAPSRMSFFGSARSAKPAPLSISSTRLDYEKARMQDGILSPTQDKGESLPPTPIQDSTPRAFDWCHDQLEKLYQRKARVETEVGDLHTQKEALRKEKEDLEGDVLRLRQDRLRLLLNKDSTEGLEDSSTSDLSKSLPMVSLEQALQERVSMLLQETTRLEALKKSLEIKA